MYKLFSFGNPNFFTYFSFVETSGAAVISVYETKEDFREWFQRERHLNTHRFENVFVWMKTKLRREMLTPFSI